MMATGSSPVRDADEATFQQTVIDRSHQAPVVVDFWASWCGPCRVLGPILEQLAEAANGDFELVKVDVDQNPRLAQQYRVQGIPAVKAFRDGQLVDEFTGALPEPRVRDWLKRIVPSGADRLVAAGRAAIESGDSATAERRFRDALVQDANHAGAAIALADLLVGRDQLDEAERLLRPFPADAAAQRVSTRIRLRRAATGADFTALGAAVAANPRDADAHLRLGLALAGDDAYTAALDHLLESVRIDRAHRDAAARKAMLDLFALLGDDDPRTRDYRNRLASVLF